MKTLLYAILVASTMTWSASHAQAQTGTQWTGIGGGTLGGHSVTMDAFPSTTYLGDFNLSTPSYASAPLANDQECLNYLCRESWQATFSPSLEDPLWYGVFVRGLDANPPGPDVRYTFDRPFVILSGFAGASVEGNTLVLSHDTFHFGILQFPGTHNSLACIDTPVTGGYQAMTFGRMDSVGTTFCDPAVANSTGLPTRISGTWSQESQSGLHLDAFQGPANQFAYFLIGTGVSEPGLAIGQGRLCLALGGGQGFARYNVIGDVRNSIGRFDSGGILRNLAGTSSSGSGFDVPTQISPALGTITAGSTWHFQLWHRDLGTQSNLSNGLSVTF